MWWRGFAVTEERELNEGDVNDAIVLVCCSIVDQEIDFVSL